MDEDKILQKIKEEEKKRKEELKQVENKLINELRRELDIIGQRIDKNNMTINSNFDEIYARLKRLDGLPPESLL